MGSTIDLTDKETARIRPYALRLMAATREIRTNQAVLRAIMETICERAGVDPEGFDIAPDLRSIVRKQERSTTVVE